MRRRARTAVAILASLLVCSCGKTDAPAQDPFAGDVARAQSRVTSDFQRSVLADGQVSRAEYEQAVDLYISCLNSNGVPAAKNLNAGGYYDYAVPGQSDVSSQMMKCAQGTVAEIDYLYTERLRNPQHQPENVIMASCLVRKGAAPKGYSGDQYASDEADSFKHAPFNADTNEAFALCSVNPSAP